MDSFDYVRSLCEAAVKVSPSLSRAGTAEKNQLLLSISDLLLSERETLIEANRTDLANAEANGLPAPMLDRLKLDEKRIRAMAESLKDIAKLPDPIGSGTRDVRPNGLVIERIRVPLGLVAIIYEARPNVTVDAAALCLKTGNAVILRGGKEAIASNRALVRLMKQALQDNGFSPDLIGLVEDTSRDSATALMKMRGLVDLLVPRGGKGLIRSVVEQAEVPVIETGAGNCHLFVDASADLDMAVKVAINAKLSRPSVCNAIETLLVHADVAEKFLKAFVEALPRPLEIRGDERVRQILDCLPASEDDWATEYDDDILAVRTVNSLDEAIAHINRYNTGHSEAIMTSSMANAERFKREVDAAAVYVNASTRFTDGGEFGFGAELGISTQKLHARGPMGLNALTTDKYLISGNGQVR